MRISNPPALETRATTLTPSESQVSASPLRVMTVWSRALTQWPVGDGEAPPGPEGRGMSDPWGSFSPCR